LLRSNLPAQVSSFVGREVELAEVRRLIAGARLVTLTGAGGAGKTRLGLQVAVELAEDGGQEVWFADLAPLGDADLVAVTVAAVLGVRQEPGRAMLSTLAEAVGGRSLLVVLDNCEHVIDACVKVADALLRACPNLRLLATSREPLGIGGERVYRVPSLGVPADGDDPAVIWASEAVRLLADRAAAQGATLGRDGPAAEVVGRLCRRLDGIPLAIELAAARLRAMSAAELEARLDERFLLLTGGSPAALPRQQTLRAMVEWSWELLTSAERAVLARLSVFAGGFGLAAAEAVAASQQVPPDEVAAGAAAACPGVPVSAVLGYLGALVDKSLVQFDGTGSGPGRYRLLETVRQYVARQLDALGPAVADSARIAHRDHYLALAEAAAPHLEEPDQAAWLERLDDELGNLRAALAVSKAQPDPGPGLRLATALPLYWRARGHAAEGAGVLQALLGVPAAQQATLPRARALAAAAGLLDRTGDYATAVDYCEEALAIARAAGDEHLLAKLLYLRSLALLRQGQGGAAQPMIEQGLGLARRLGNPHLTGCLLWTRSYAMAREGDHVGAARDAAEALELFRQAGDQLQVGAVLGNLGYYELSAGGLDVARRHLAEALDIARALGARSDMVYGTVNLGLAEYLGGSPGAAEPLFAESLDLARRMGMKASMAYALIGLAMVGHGGAGSAARLHGAADQALADLGETVDPLEGRLAGLDRQRLRAAMGTETFDEEYGIGRALGLARVLAAVGGTDQASGQARAARQARPGMQTGRARALASEPDAAGSGAAAPVLTPRELEVLTLVAQGLSNPDVAQRLSLSEHTVHRHLSNILRKLGLSSRVAAAAWGARNGLI
jgi:non-specific serine/threonine protein kinase